MIQFRHVPAVAVWLVAAAGSAAEPSPFDITARRAETRIAVARDGDTTRLDVVSPFGIDTATVRRTGDAWPERLVVQLHLKGLESFRMSDGRVTVEVAASAAGEPNVRASLRERGEERPIDAESPYWPEVRVVRGGKTGATSFEVAPPRKLFERNPQEITLWWIDFYRG